MKLAIEALLREQSPAVVVGNVYPCEPTVVGISFWLVLAVRGNCVHAIGFSGSGEVDGIGRLDLGSLQSRRPFGRVDLSAITLEPMGSPTTIGSATAPEEAPITYALNLVALSILVHHGYRSGLINENLSPSQRDAYRRLQNLGLLELVGEPLTVHSLTDAGVAHLAKIQGLALGACTPAHTLKIGEYWKGQGGTYAGIARGEEGQPDYHLVRYNGAAPDDLTWQAAMDEAKILSADGHRDFALPTRPEAALLYANRRTPRERSTAGNWVWTSAVSDDFAYAQDTYDGQQIRNQLGVKLRAQFVRRVAL